MDPHSSETCSAKLEALKRAHYSSNLVIEAFRSRPSLKQGCLRSLHDLYNRRHRGHPRLSFPWMTYCPRTRWHHSDCHSWVSQVWFDQPETGGSFCQATSVPVVVVSDQFGSWSPAAEELEGCRTMDRMALPILRDLPTHPHLAWNQMHSQVCSHPRQLYNSHQFSSQTWPPMSCSLSLLPRFPPKSSFRTHFAWASCLAAAPPKQRRSRPGHLSVSS